MKLFTAALKQLEFTKYHICEARIGLMSWEKSHSKSLGGRGGLHKDVQKAQ